MRQSIKDLPLISTYNPLTGQYEVYLDVQTYVEKLEQKAVEIEELKTKVTELEKRQKAEV